MREAVLARRRGAHHSPRRKEEGPCRAQGGDTFLGCDVPLSARRRGGGVRRACGRVACGRHRRVHRSPHISRVGVRSAGTRLRQSGADRGVPTHSGARLSCLRVRRFGRAACEGRTYPEGREIGVLLAHGLQRRRKEDDRAVLGGGRCVCRAQTIRAGTAGFVPSLRSSTPGWRSRCLCSRRT